MDMIVVTNKVYVLLTVKLGRVTVDRLLRGSGRCSGQLRQIIVVPSTSYISSCT
jgi:hypothetical protein